ncbi:prenyltransferase/squalene oxidase repeat-containing protein [Desulfobacter postgatei]|jgi:malonyl-CoA O-methyltransferase|uniref:prenyltransferase/squalene oxidase repeat-containing protein n=1 Tax=Desulfobacter postgatei TaxID=2293 RepID=UPI002A36B152|nr:prenyltransferase/squalene oxidase repeat-containing protein [Desulfobacter postgatei]MDX9964225.1 prenyltransferase/squalene oxidase repeat-containing protein [Desulfobacter postgatei]
MINQISNVKAILNNLYFSLRKHEKKNYARAEKKAVQWFQDHIIEGGGFPVSTGQNVSYPEVTGYIIPTLYNAGEKEFALRMAEWLITVQHDSGAFGAPDGVPYSFDTGQVLRGLLQVMEDIPQAEDSARKSCDWLLTQILPSGEVTTPSTDMWNLPEGRRVSQNIHLYILPPLAEAGRRLGKTEYTNAVERALAFYKENWNLKDFNTLSHFFGYVMEALCDLGETDLARAGMENIDAIQKLDGSIPAYSHVKWVCTPGTAQLAIVWYKLGEKKRADAALRFLRGVQNQGGGFFGSYGKGANYFPREEIPWAAKYFLDAIHLS